MQHKEAAELLGLILPQHAMHLLFYLAPNSIQSCPVRVGRASSLWTAANLSLRGCVTLGRLWAENAGPEKRKYLGAPSQATSANATKAKELVHIRMFRNCSALPHRLRRRIQLKQRRFCMFACFADVQILPF